MARYFEVTLLGALGSEQIINRMNFTETGVSVGTNAALPLLVALGKELDEESLPSSGSFLDRFLAAQQSNYSLREIIVRNLFSVVDFITQPLAGAGWQGKIVMGPGLGALTFAAAKLRTNRTRTDVRRGTLALTPGPEDAQEGANVWTIAHLAKLQEVCDALNQPPNATISGDTFTFLPSVFGKEKYVVPNSSPARYAYRYYKDIDEFPLHAAVDVTWSPVPQITSQVTRKIGRGA